MNESKNQIFAYISDRRMYIGNHGLNGQLESLVFYPHNYKYNS